MGVIVALAMLLLLGALAGSVGFLAAGETRTAAVHRSAAEVLYAADVGIHLGMSSLVAVPDWSMLLGGGVTSPFVDGASGGTRRTAAGPLDLLAATNDVRCGRPTACTAEDMAAATADRPWGANNPVWQLYAHGPLRDLVGVEGDAPDVYVIVWVGDDPSECDGLPGVDGGPCAAGGSRGKDAVSLLSHAYGPYGTRRAIRATVARSALAGVRVTSWREVG